MASELVHKNAKRKPVVVRGLMCYVCNHSIKDAHTDMATTISTDPLTVRHNRCAAGSAAWLGSGLAEKSELKEFFVTNGEESAIMGELPKKVKKAFPKKDPDLTPEQKQLVGRVKYMAYMTTVLKAGSIDWHVQGSNGGVAVWCTVGMVYINDNGERVFDNIPEADAAVHLKDYFLAKVDEKKIAEAKQGKGVDMQPAGESPAPIKTEGKEGKPDGSKKEKAKGGEKAKGSAQKPGKAKGSKKA